MKLKNKKTGEIIEAESCNNTDGCISIYYEEKDGQIGTKGCYTSLAKLNEEWEDYEEPKGYWFIDCAAPYPVDFCEFNEDTEDDKAIGNYFETKEEAKKAVEKLKAWKRLKDKGFRFESIIYDRIESKYIIRLLDPTPSYEEQKEYRGELDLLFGGEE